MKVLLTMIFFVVLSGCSTSVISKEKASVIGKEKTIEGISFTKLGEQQVVLVERLKRTDIIQASTKSSEVELVRIAKKPVDTKKFKRKVQFGGGQGGGSGFVGGQTDDSIFVIQPADGEVIVVCGETQNPCVVDEEEMHTEGSCGADFGEPQTEPLEQFYSENEEGIRKFCANTEGGGNDSI